MSCLKVQLQPALHLIFSSLIGTKRFSPKYFSTFTKVKVTGLPCHLRLDPSNTHFHYFWAPKRKNWLMTTHPLFSFINCKPTTCCPPLRPLPGPANAPLSLKVVNPRPNVQGDSLSTKHSFLYIPFALTKTQHTFFLWVLGWTPTARLDDPLIPLHSTRLLPLNPTPSQTRLTHLFLRTPVVQFARVFITSVRWRRRLCSSGTVSASTARCCIRNSSRSALCVCVCCVHVYVYTCVCVCVCAAQAPYLHLQHGAALRTPPNRPCVCACVACVCMCVHICVRACLCSSGTVSASTARCCIRNPSRSALCVLRACVYVCNVCVHMYACVQLWVQVCEWACANLHAYICACVHMCVYIHANICVNVCLCVFVCTFVCKRG